MDYTIQKLGFKARKVLRYFRLYGVRRTLMKVKGQYHMKRKYNILPANRDGSFSMQAHIGIIGCGNYSFSTIAFYLNRAKLNLIRGVMDIDVHRAASLFENYNAVYFTDNSERIVNDKDIDLVYIASNHASHAEYAIRCIEAGKHVHIEKPHVVSEDQLARLIAAMRMHPSSKVFLGFNRPRTKLFQTLKALLSKESGPLMINWFVAGHEIPDNHWYFDRKEGGRVLGNLCHWTDLTLQLVGLENAFPCHIIPSVPEGSKSDFVVSLIFADQSCASITFSAKGHTFEGVREVLNIHKGNLLGNLTDFQTLSVEVVEQKIVRRQFYRDHGHNLNILNSLNSDHGEDPRYVIATAKLFLAIRGAIDGGTSIALSREDAIALAQQ
jgi:predicted dehydrogenase